MGCVDWHSAKPRDALPGRSQADSAVEAHQTISGRLSILRDIRTTRLDRLTPNQQTPYYRVQRTPGSATTRCWPHQAALPAPHHRSSAPRRLRSSRLAAGSRGPNRESRRIPAAAPLQLPGSNPARPRDARTDERPRIILLGSRVLLADSEPLSHYLHTSMPDVVILRGTLRRGDPCWSIETDDGARVYIVGDLTGVRDADVVYAYGTPAKAPLCGGEALALMWISTKYGGSDALPTVVTRDVIVSVTRSSADNSPRFRMEGKPRSLNADGSKWRGAFDAVNVTGELDLSFESDAWPNQQFTLSVEARDPTNRKVWKKDLQGSERKGMVLITGSLDVGAASKPSEKAAPIAAIVDGSL